VGISWLDKYLGDTPADATAVTPARAPVPVPNTIGADTRPDWARHTLPKPFEDKVQRALNALGLGNPLPHLYDAQQAAAQGHKLAAVASLAAAVPVLPEGEGGSLLARVLGRGAEGAPIAIGAAASAAPGALEAQALQAAHTTNGQSLIGHLAGLGHAEPAVEHLRNAQQLAALGAHDEAATRVAQAQVNVGKPAFDELMQQFPSLARYAPKAPPVAQMGGTQPYMSMADFARQAAPAEAAPVLKLSAKEQKYADLLRRQGVKNPEAQAASELRGGEPSGRLQ